MSPFESHDTEHVVDQDLRALGQASKEDLPDWNSYAAAPERRRPTQWETLFMSSVQAMKARPWAATAALAGVLVLALLMIPISYTRTSGYEVSLRLPEETSASAAQQISVELKRALKADNISYSSDSSGDDRRPLLTARVSGRPSAAIRKEAESFARLLGEKNITASAVVSPIREQASTSLFAYAADRILEIRINDEGRSDSEIEADIRAQLEAAGLENSTVTYTRQGDEKQITIRTQQGEAAEVPEDVNVIVNGVAGLEAKEHKVQIHSDKNLSDAELKAEIERQLKASGVEAEVTVTNGKISIQREPRRGE